MGVAGEAGRGGRAPGGATELPDHSFLLVVFFWCSSLDLSGVHKYCDTVGGLHAHLFNIGFH